LYELAIQRGDKAPIVRSNTTGKWFTLTWAEIINLAVDAGIDK